LLTKADIVKAVQAAQEKRAAAEKESVNSRAKY
jgi:hypothetical protein